jgi:hypothetical protein
MTGGGAPEHWFDRLAQRLTRREAVKAGIAAAAAFTLPLVRPAGASAEQFVINVDPCFTGCKAFAHTQFYAAKTSCTDKYGGAANIGLAGFYYATGGLFGYAAHDALATRSYHSCLDTAMMHQKVSMFDCSQAGCSGFDPRQKGGPCETCSNFCCVCPNIPEGYICCFYQCDDPNHNCCGS